MEKNTLKVIAVIAIVIGGVGITFGYFALAQPESIEPILLMSVITNVQSNVVKSWCKYDEIFITNPISNWLTIDDLTIDFRINQRGLVLIDFCGWMSITALDFLNFRILIDGVEFDLWTYDDSYDGSYCWVSAQNATLSVGPHNASVQVYGTNLNDYVRNSSLLVRFYPY